MSDATELARRVLGDDWQQYGWTDEISRSEVTALAQAVIDIEANRKEQQDANAVRHSLENQLLRNTVHRYEAALERIRVGPTLADVDAMGGVLKTKWYSDIARTALEEK